MKHTARNKYGRSFSVDSASPCTRTFKTEQAVEAEHQDATERVPVRDAQAEVLPK
jgi:hypothetical protein